MPNYVSSIEEASDAAGRSSAAGSVSTAKSLASRLWPYLLLLGLFWVVRYWHSSEFGLYEDDLTYMPAAAKLSMEELVDYIFEADRYINLHGNGRPLHPTFITAFMNLGLRLGDLQTTYLIGFAIEAANVVLLYALLRRIHSKPLGVLGGLVYVLYSADTTQANLTLAFGMQTSFTFFLLATHSYLSRKRWLAYGLAAATVLTYEAAFTVFFAVPLLAYQPGRRWRRAALRHVLTVGLMFVVLAALRIFVADDRLGGLSIWEAIYTPIEHMLQGPIVSLGTYLYRPLQALQSLDREIVIALLVVFSAAALLLARLDLRTPKDLAADLRASIKNVRGKRPGLSTAKSAWKGFPEELKSLVRLAATGLLMLVLAYPLTFTIRAYAISGRDTRVHSAGVFGAAILLGALLLIVLWVAESFSRKRLVVVGIATWLGLMAGYGFVIQRDYRLAWAYQKSFWSNLIPLVSDAGDGTVILIDPEGLQDTRQIGANYWNLPRVLDQLYNFPDGWDRAPKVYRLSENWQEGILTEDNMLSLNDATVFAPPQSLGTFDPANAILIDTSNGELRRVSGALTIEDRSVNLKPVSGSGGLLYSPGFLHRYLVDETSSDR